MLVFFAPDFGAEFFRNEYKSSNKNMSIRLLTPGVNYYACPLQHKGIARGLGLRL